MTDRLTVDTITSDQLDALQLKAARMEHAVAKYAKLRVELEDTKARAETDRAALKRVRDYLEPCLKQVAVDPAEIWNVLIGAVEPPLSPYYSHEACGFHWHGRDDMDIPMRDGQPICPRCEPRRLTATTAPTWPRRAWDLGLLHKGGDPHHCPACVAQPEPPKDFICPGADANAVVLANPQPATSAALDEPKEPTVEEGPRCFDVLACDGARCKRADEPKEH
ncbi:hypothetical protein QBA57_28700 [Streptomyces scabiei]|uniref:hypothetical protein n=1 Tax=Streptomyces scabiei TaxID=1930 RepID=UPI001B3448D3|nr:MULTISPECIES: hypothetical protein [Streptomyces]MBP5883152.1 hypothetical protein [Streptomyces sp. LBUM 1487]MDX2628606.1 hypothetical protein [Streptomyces scabiei]MDX3162728.1 hypothetical protein [Streptomyces scabiei]